MDNQELDFNDMKTLDTVSETDDDGTPLGALDVPLEEQKASAETKLAAGQAKLKDLEDKAMSVERELEARGISIDKDRDMDRGIEQEQGIEFDR